MKLLEALDLIEKQFGPDVILKDGAYDWDLDSLRDWMQERYDEDPETEKEEFALNEYYQIVRVDDDGYLRSGEPAYYAAI